jgi:hypothetical protein
MNLELPSATAKKLEQLRRSLGTTRIEAVDRMLDNYLEDKKLLELLLSPNPVTANMTEDQIYEITTAAVKQDRVAQRAKRGGRN